MSIWVTPAGSIGTYTQQRQFVYNFQATPNLGGKIVFQLQGIWPTGTFSLTTVELTPGIYTGILTATPDYVPVLTTYNFSISATEITGSGSNPNIRAFSLGVNTTQWAANSPAFLGGYIELTPLNIQLEATPSVPGNTITYTLLNGNLPESNNVNSPIVLSSGGLITGTPGQVSQTTTSRFTVRALEFNGLSQQVCFVDRTFSLDISGTTAPSFVTPAGSTLLNILDSTWVDYQVLISNPDPGTQAVITVAADALPPGLQITPEGVIRGYADPPVDGAGNPITENYSFTLRVRSESGESLSEFNINVQNQETLPGFTGREPTLLNTQPLTIVINPDDPYAAYYNDGNLGEINTDNYYIFKFIGYDFDGDDLTYDLVPGNVFSDLGLNFDPVTGWVTGTIAQTLVPSVDTYNFLVSVYKTASPSIRSQNFKFTITIINNIDTQVVWLTNSNLGSINNGSTSLFSVLAQSTAGKNLEYRLAGNNFSTNLYTIVGTSGDLYSFGALGGFVVGTVSGSDTTWEQNTQTTLSQQQFTILSSVYNPFTAPPSIIVVGHDVSNKGVFVKSDDGINWFYNFAPGLPSRLNSVTFNNSSVSPVYVAVGSDGYSMRSTDGTNWTQYTTGVTDDLNCVTWDGTRFVAVGNRGTVLYSTSGTSWTTVSTTITNNFTGITYTGTSWIIVGNLGIIVRASDITNFSSYTYDSVFTNFDYNRVVDNAGDIVIVGTRGTIVTSINDGVNWTVQNSGTTNDFYDVIYDSVQTNAFYACGVAGSIFTSQDLINWTSPTITQLPDNLVFQNNGDITGRLAFESQSSVTPVGTRTTYTFTVQAYCVDLGFDEITSTKQFEFTTVQKFALPYDNLYIKALAPETDRDFVIGMLENTNIVPPDSVFRPEDPYFGRAKNITYQHMYGVPSVASGDFYTDYIQAVTENHYWRNIVLGPIKTAIARNSNNEIIYEVVYSEVIDNLVNAAGVSISKQITWPRNIYINQLNNYTSVTALNDSMTYFDPVPSVKTVSNTVGSTLYLNNVNDITVGMTVTGQGVANDGQNEPPLVTVVNPNTSTVTLNVSQTLIAGSQILFSESAVTSLSPDVVRVLYPNSLHNMREQIGDTIGFINDSSLLPLWMTSQQANGDTLGYTQAWVLVYTKPGQSQSIAASMNAYFADTERYLNDIKFTIDRFEVNRSLTYGFEGGTASAPVWNTLPSGGIVSDSQDAYIYFPQKTILPDHSQT